MSDRKIRFKIITPERIVYESEIDSVTLPTKLGVITVMAGHVPLVSLLSPGEMVIDKDDTEYNFAVSTGFIEVRPESEVVVLADTAERAEDIDLRKAEAARDRAKAMLSEKQKLSEVQFAKLQAILEREMARVRVRTKHPDRHRPPGA